MVAEHAASIVRRRRRTAIASALLFVGHQVGEAAVPIVIGATIDRAITTRDGAAMARWLVVLVATFAFLSLSWRFGSRASQITQRGVDHDVRVALTRRLVDWRGMLGPARHRGDLLSLATNDTFAVGLGAGIFANVAAALAALTVAFVALVLVSVLLGVLVVIGSAVLLVLTNRISERLERRSTDEQQRAAQAGAIATDIVVGMRVIHGIGAEHASAVRYASASRSLLHSTIATARVVAGIDAATTLLNGAFLATVALAGARLAESGSITVGQLVAAFGLAQFLVGPWARLAGASAAMARARASRRRVDAVLTVASLTPSPTPSPSPNTSSNTSPSPGVHGTEPTLELRDVSCGSLRGITFAVGAGELVAVLTSDPADGDSLAGCIDGSIALTAGSAHVGGIALTDWDPAGLRGQVLVAPRRAVVFGGDLADNVRAVAPDAQAADRALEAAAAADVLLAVAHRAAGTVTEHGLSLSGGQRQRIALARALGASKPVLVLVEPTSSVDAVTEALIASRVRALRADTATVVVTTSPAWLAVADRVVALDQGRQATTGVHGDLVRDDPRYASMVAG